MLPPLTIPSLISALRALMLAIALVAVSPVLPVQAGSGSSGHSDDDEGPEADDHDGDRDRDDRDSDDRDDDEDLYQSEGALRLVAVDTHGRFWESGDAHPLNRSGQVSGCNKCVTYCFEMMEGAKKGVLRAETDCPRAVATGENSTSFADAAVCLARGGSKKGDAFFKQWIFITAGEKAGFGIEFERYQFRAKRADALIRGVKRGGGEV